MIRVGVIGGGYGRDVHLPGLAALPEVEIAAVADGGSGRIARAALGVPYAPSWQALLDHEGLDAVAIAAPPALHGSIVGAALARGLHVLCEKPFGRDIAQAQAMQASLPDGIVGAIGYQFRYEPGLCALRQTLADGRIGRLRRIDVTWVTAGRADPHRPFGFQHDAAAGGGVIESFLCHALDYALWLAAGRAPLRLCGRSDILIGHRPDHTGTARNVTAEDSVDMMMELDGAVVFTATITNCQPGAGLHRVRLAGDAGLAELDQHLPVGPHRLTLATHAAPQPTVTDLADPAPCADSRLPAFSRLAADFIAAINGAPTPDLPRFADAWRVRAAIAALRQAIGQGGWVAPAAIASRIRMEADC